MRTSISDPADRHLQPSDLHLWKDKTIIIIPKSSDPDNLSQCRNLSCTPLFSWVLETFVLKRLKGETSLGASQYGGLRGCGEDHFLVKTWDEVLEALEEDRTCVNLISINFEKAFNRMDHRECLIALQDHGVSSPTLQLVGVFFYMRHRFQAVREENSPWGQSPRQHPRQLPILYDLGLARQEYRLQQRLQGSEQQTISGAGCSRSRTLRGRS